MARARKDGARAIGLHTSALMRTARQMDERMGFYEVGERPTTCGLWYWRLVLPLSPAA